MAPEPHLSAEVRVHETDAFSGGRSRKGFVNLMNGAFFGNRNCDVSGITCCRPPQAFELNESNCQAIHSVLAATNFRGLVLLETVRKLTASGIRGVRICASDEVAVQCGTPVRRAAGKKIPAYSSRSVGGIRHHAERVGTFLSAARLSGQLEARVSEDRS